MTRRTFSQMCREKQIDLPGGCTKATAMVPEGDNLRKALLRDRNQQSSGRFSPWNDDQMPSAVSSSRSIEAN
jgi:hypothetical protein